MSYENGVERRRHPRFKCKIKCKLEYFEGVPGEIDVTAITPVTDDGVILNISQSGLLLVTNLLVTPGMRLGVGFNLSGKSVNFLSSIISTGRRKDNPSEKVLEFSDVKAKLSNYIAVEFDQIIPELSEQDL